jgi:peptide/nickel transport system permease protein
MPENVWNASARDTAEPDVMSDRGMGTAGPPAPAPPTPVEDIETSTLTHGQLAWRRFRHHKAAIVSSFVLLLIALATIFAGAITRYTYEELDLTSISQGPTWKHLFGTDTLGRDEFTRVLYGGRISLVVGVTVAVVAGIIGTTLGGLAGYHGGKLDNMLMRMTDLFLAVPFLVILIMASSVLHGGVTDIVIVLSLFFWMAEARIVRGVFLQLREQEFVEAARASGATSKRIIFVHMVPNAMGPIIVGVTLGVAAAILTESALSFLGYGIQPPTPSWGNMLAEHRNQITAAPWLLWFPGLMILITALSVNFVGDGLRDALDPHQRVSSD